MSLAGSARTLHDPLQTLGVQTLHHSASVSVSDVRCRPHDFSRGPEEWSRTHQIVFPRRGVFEREARGDKLLADANHALFFQRDEPYRVVHPGGCGDDCTVFAFDDALLGAAVRQFDPAGAASVEQPFRFSHTAIDQRVFLLHAQLRCAALSGEAEPLALDEAALQLLAALLENTYRQRGISGSRARPASSELHHEQVRRTVLLLSTRFAEALSLDAIARAVHCSPYHLARLFRRISGLSIHQYRHRLRLREALQRLAEGRSELSALALELGFSSHSHLTDSFRQAFGVPPSAVRRSLGSRSLRELSRNLEVPGLART
jgi:AraC family transcriptional regulator